MSRQRTLLPVLILSIATVARLGGVVLSALRINPYATSDATKFATHAREIAMTTLAGNPQTGLLFWADGRLIDGAVKTYNLWGLSISPAYLLPGPSTIYATVALAALGVLAVWNVYAIGRTLHSREAGVVAALPVAVYPSIALVQSTLLREAAVLFFVTSAARLALEPSRFSRPVRAALCGVALVAAGLLRWELFMLE